MRLENFRITEEMEFLGRLSSLRNLSLRKCGIKELHDLENVSR
jgi:hypothetical protein